MLKQASVLEVTAAKDIWEEDPEYLADYWRYEVQNNNTRLGYWDWVDTQKEAEAEHSEE